MIYGHIGNTADWHSLQNAYIYQICSIERLWTGFFMCAFFVITGYCSNFKKDFSLYIVNNVRTILIPSIVFSFVLQRIDIILSGVYDWKDLFSIDYKWYIFYGGPFWFLSTMFVSKILYWVLLSIARESKLRYCYLLMFYLVGFMLNLYDIGPDWWYVRQACMLTGFLEIGRFLRERSISRYGSYSIILYTLSITAVFLLTDFGKIGIFRRITVDWITLVPNLINAVSGTVMIIWISQKIRSSRILTYIGRNSLLFYCIQEFALNYNYNMFEKALGTNTFISSLVAVLIYLGFVILSCYTFSKIIMKTKLVNIIGKG